VTEEGTAKLLDFGLAKLKDNLSNALSQWGPVSVGAADHGIAAIASLTQSSTTETVEAPPVGALASPAQPSLPPVVGINLGRRGDLGRAHTLPEALTSGRYPSIEPPAKSLTIDGSILGTPAYMAPEAWRGEVASGSTDVYSLGALLYELCSGQPPHDYESMDDIRKAATAMDVRPLAEVMPGVGRRFAAIVDRCLRRDPARRFASGEELQRELEALATELTIPTLRVMLRDSIRKRWALALIIAAALVVPPVAALSYFYRERAKQRRIAALVKNRRSVAVLGLAALSRSGRDDGFSAAFSELLSAELAIGERLRRVPAESVSRMKIDLRLAAAAVYDAETLRRIRQHLGADLVVIGSYEADAGHGERLRILIEVRDSQSGARLAASRVSGSPRELFELVTHTGSELRQQLGLGGLSSAQAAALRAVRPASPEVAELYAEGRDLLRHFDAVGARRLLEKAVAADPDYPLGHLALADVFTTLGYDEKAKASAKRAVEMSSNLPREDRYLIEARYREATKEWDKAISLYLSLWTFFPESLDIGLKLAGAQYSAGQLEAARATAQKLRQLPPPASQDPRLDILEAKAIADAGDSQVACTLLDHAARSGEAIGAPLFVARARLEKAYVLENLGQQEPALKEAELAKQLFTSAGDRGAAADAIMATSSAYTYQGDIARALTASQEAHELLLRIQNSPLTAANLCNMGILHTKKGNLELARARAEGGLLLSREIGLLESVGAGLIALGTISMLEANLDGAMQSFEQAETALAELGDPRMTAWVYWHMAQVMLLRGDLAAARKKHEAALAIREKSGLKGFAAESQAALAALALEERLPSEAEMRARAAARQFAEDRQADNEAWAQTVLAAALWAQGKRAEAEQAMERGRSLAANCQNLMIRLYVRRESAILKANQAELSQHELTATLAEAKAAGLVVESFESELAKLRIMLESSHGKGLNQQILLLANKAAHRGLGLIAQKATAMIQLNNNESNRRD